MGYYVVRDNNDVLTDFIYCEACILNNEHAMALRDQGQLTMGKVVWWDEGDYGRQVLDCSGCLENLDTRYPDPWGAWDALEYDDFHAHSGLGDNKITLTYEHVVTIRDTHGRLMTYKVEANAKEPTLNTQNHYTNEIDAYSGYGNMHLGGVAWEESFLRSCLTDYYVNERLG